MIEHSLLATKLGRYRKADFHVHSNFSDGEDSIEDLVKAAVDLRLEAIAITDHVRRETTWLDDYVREIKEIKSTYGKKIDIYSGIEAKAIDPEGNIDTQPEFLNKVDIVLGVIHKIPTARDNYLKADEVESRADDAIRLWQITMKSLIRNPAAQIIAHFELYLKKSNITLPEKIWRNLVAEAKKQKKIFEVNLKHEVPEKPILKSIKENKITIVKGSDSHSVDELYSIWKQSNHTS